MKCTPSSTTGTKIVTSDLCSREHRTIGCTYLVLDSLFQLDEVSIFYRSSDDGKVEKIDECGKTMSTQDEKRD